MSKFTRLTSIILSLAVVMSVSSCNKAFLSEGYKVEDAGGTGYGATVKSALYIEDFYFMTVGTLKSKIDLIIGSAHYCRDNNELLPVYTLNNGDSIAVTFDSEKSTVTSAEYTYSTGEKENFFDILVSLGVLKSSFQESNGGDTVVIPSENGGANDTKPPENNDTPTVDNTPSNTQTAIQGEVFATGMYNLTLVEAVLSVNMPRSSVLAGVGKPNYFFSTNFAYDSYIIDCYNLNDGSKLYLDYGFERDTLRCAAVYKNGTYTSILSSPWDTQVKPAGFTRTTINPDKINSLSKNLTPTEVYKKLGEPSWYEGSRGSYSDVYALSNGNKAYLNFGSAHNKLTSVSVKGEDGTETVITLK